MENTIDVKIVFNDEFSFPVDKDLWIESNNDSKIEYIKRHLLESEGIDIGVSLDLIKSLDAKLNDEHNMLKLI